MKKWIAVLAAGAVAVVAGGALLLGTAAAAGPGRGQGPGAGIGGRDVPVAVAAELTGLTEAQVLEELQGGKTLVALLQEKGVDLEAFHQAVAEARTEAIEAAVEAGTITREQADLMLQRMAERQATGEHGPRAGAGLRDGTCDGTGPHGAAAGFGQAGAGTGPGAGHRYGGR